jgi:hypothetical protein
MASGVRCMASDDGSSSQGLTLAPDSKALAQQATHGVGGRTSSRCGAARGRWLSPLLFLHNHRVADVDRVVVPLGVRGAQADAAVADILKPE